MANIEIPVSLGLKDALSQINLLRLALLLSVKLDSSAGKSLISLLDSALKSVDKLSGKMSTAFKSTTGSQSFLKDYEKMIELLSAATLKMTNLGVTDIKFSVSDLQVVDQTIQKILSLLLALSSIQDGKAVEVINMSLADGIDNLRQLLHQLKIDASKLSFDEIDLKLTLAVGQANIEVKTLTDNITNINALIGKLNTLGFLEITKLSDVSTKGVSRILDAGNVDSVNNKLLKLAATMSEITVKPMTVTTGLNIDSIIESQTRAIEKKYNELIQVILQNKDKITLVINEVTLAGIRTSANGKTSSGHWTNEQMQLLMSMPSVENIINRLKADTTLNFDNLGIRLLFAKFREALNEELNSLGTQEVNLLTLRDNVKDLVSKVFEDVGETIVGNRSLLLNSIKSLFSNLGINGDELKKIFDINSISSGDKMVDVIDRIREGLTSYIQTLDLTANTDLAARLKEALAAFDGLTSALVTNKNVAGESGSAALSLLDLINTLALQILDLINKYNLLTGKNLNFDPGNIDGAKASIESYILSLNKLLQKQKALSNVQMAVNRWMGFWQVLNMTKSAINDMKLHIQELDTVMTSISVVTNFSQEDLWEQISLYSEIARQYGVAIKGVYEVSLIYYQQGLQLNDVMTLTTETLKMARIAGLDYATAADYMTTAIRGFKLEMTDAAHVTDVFSALAATTASSTEEIATAISKTAASALAVGASFEATSAMMATMIATTRESATNIGTALKSVISRYGEMTSDPSKTVDSEGEEMSLNRVDKALLTVGITIHDTAGLFRDFDDVMLELMEKWDSLDSLSQRYIATLMAGNRQQSRFLALVSNVDEYKKALLTAMDSEGAGELLTLKTLDSIDAKIEKMKVTIQEFYTSSGIEELYKKVLDTITNIVSAANSLPKVFGKIPVSAVAMGAVIISAVKSAIRVILGEILAGLEMMKGNTQSTMTGLISMMALGGRESGRAYREAQEAEMNGGTTGKSTISKGAVIGGMVLRYAGAALSIAGAGKTLQGMNAYGASLTSKEDLAAALQVRTGGILGILGSTASGAAMGASFGAPGMIIGAAIGGVKGLVENIATLTSANEMYNVSVAREIELSGKRLEVAKLEQLEAKNSEKLLEQAYTKLKDLEEHLYDSAEALQEYYDYMNLLADSYPAYVAKIDEANNAIIYSGTLEEQLAKARELTAGATTAAIEAELEKADWQMTSISNFQEGLKGLYDNNSSMTLIRLLDLALQVRLSMGIGVDFGGKFTYEKFNLGLSNEEAAEYLFRSYIARTPQEVEGYDRKTGKITTGRYGPDGKYHTDTYLSLLMRKNNEGRSILDEIMSNNSLNLGAGENALELLRETFYNLLTNLLNESEKAGKKVSLETITKNKNIKEVKDIYNLADNEFLAAVTEAKAWANQAATTTETTKKGIETILTNAKAREKVTAKINTIENSLDKVLAEQYENLLAYGISAKFGKDIDQVSSEEFDTVFTNLSNWIKNNLESAEALANIDYSLYTSFEKLKDSIKNFADLDDGIESLIEKDFTEARDNAVTLYKNLLIGIFGDKKAPDWLSDTDKFTNRTLTAIQSDLKLYQSFIDKQQYAQAEAYLHSMQEIYGEKGIGGLSDENQTKAYDIIKDLDLSDPEALRSAAETFADMGSDFAGLSELFTNAALRWAVSAATLLEQLASSTLETAKSIESSISDMSKVFKYSEALEKAQALMDANEGVEFEELFTYDKDLGGYIKSAKAFLLEMAEFLETQYDNIKLAISDNETILPLVEAITGLNIREQYLKDMADTSLEGDRSRWAKNQFKKYLSMVKPEATDADIDRLWIEYTKMIDAFEALKETGEKDWNTFVEEYLKTLGEDLAELLEKILQMPQQMAREALQSFDYKSIVSGQGTTLNKETFKALLQSATDGLSISDNIANFLWELLVKGEIDKFNNWMKWLKLDNLQVSKGETDRTRFEAFYDAYQKIAGDESPLWNALDSETQKFLTEIAGITEADYTTDPAAAALNLWAVIIEFINNGVATMNEVSESISALSNKAYGGTSKEQSYQLLDKYKDGLTSEELVALLGENNGLLIDKSTGLLSDKAAEYLIYDNGKFVAKAGQDAASVLQFLAHILGFAILKNTDEYKQTIKASVDEQIALNKANSQDLQLNEVLSLIFSGNEGGLINLAGLNTTQINLLKAAGYDIEGQILTVGTEQAMNNALQTLLSLTSSGSYATWLKTYNPLSTKAIGALTRELQSKVARNAVFESITGETITLSAAEALSLALLNTTDYNMVLTLMQDMGFKWDQAALVWKASAESIEAAKLKIQQSWDANEIDNETYLNLMASLDETANAINPKTKLDNAILDMLLNYTNASEAMRAAFINNFYQYGAAVTDIFKANDNGTYDIDVAALKSFLDSIGFEYDEAAMSLILTITDAYFSNIETASKYVSEGTSSFADMQTFTDSFNKLVKPDIAASFSDLFVYDTELNNFKLNSGSLLLYIEALKEQLKELGLTDDIINEYIKDRTVAILQESLDITTYLNANNIIEQLKSLKQFALTLRDLGFNDVSDFTKLDNQIKNIKDMSIDMIISILELGGEEAVKLLVALKGESVTSDEIAEVYGALINLLRTALSELTKNVGDTVTGLAAGLIRATGLLDSFKEVGNGDIIITSAKALIEALKNLYKRMKDSNESTAADINSMFADLLESNFKQENDIKDMLELGGAGIDVHKFGEVLAAYDRDFETFFNEGLINIDLFGKVIISNFNNFATAMGWDYNSSEFLTYYETYVDSIVSALNKPLEAMKKTTEQINSILEAKVGEAINVSSIETALTNRYGLNYLAGIVSKYGATLELGILTISDTTNILLLVSEIANKAAEAGAIIPEELAEITDAVVEMLSNIVSLLSSGLEGSLTNVLAEQLNSWYKNLQLASGIFENQVKSLNFILTQEGLRIANDSARELYLTIKDIDATLGNIAFNSLKESLIASEDEFKTILDTAAYINKLRSQIEDPTNANRIESLEKELELAEKINATRSIDTEDDSFKFMEGKIPEALNNPLNYWKNWAEAFKAMQEAGQASGKAKNTIGYQDFYNIITEMGHLAELSGNAVTLGEHIVSNSETAANLITQAAGALKNIDGEMKIDLSKLNIDFSSGLKDVGKLVDALVDALASEQIHMLDAVISVLEIIVAMEDLKELDINGDLTLDFDELGIKVNKLDNNKITEVDGTLLNVVDKLLDLKTTIDGETSILDALTVSTGTAEVSMRDFLMNFRNVDWLAEKGINGNMFQTFFSNMLKLASDPTWQDESGTIEDFFLKWANLDWGDLALTARSKDYTLRLGNEANVLIDWTTANYKGLQALFDEYKGKTDEEIRKEIEDLISKDKTDGNESLTLETNKRVKLLQNKVIEIVDEKTKEGTGKFKVAGHSEEYNSLEEATAASNVYDTGADNVKVTLQDGQVTAKGKLKVGSIELDVESNGDDTDVSYIYNGTTYHGNNANEVLDNIISTEFLKDGQKIDRSSAAYLEIAVELGFSVTPILTYEISGKKALGDLNTDASLRNSLNEFIKNRSNWDTSAGGNIQIGDKAVKVTLAEGVEYTIPKGKLTFDDSGNLILDSLYNYFLSALGVDLGLKDTISLAITGSFKDLPTALEGIDAGPVEGLANAINSLADAISRLSSFNYAEIAANLALLNGGNSEALNTSDFNFSELDLMIRATAEIVEVDTSRLDLRPIETELIIHPDGLIEEIPYFKTILEITTVGGVWDIPDFTTKLTIETTEKKNNNNNNNNGGGGGGNKTNTSINMPWATGNVGLAYAKGTLMGELGPELVVSNGRYFVAGQNGAEMVNLADDAIVFNHLQTEQLLKHGMSSGRGRAVTNERNAVAFATGNFEGPAMASASAALNALKQLRAMWESLRNASVSDLAGGGGGGGGGGGDKIVDPRAWIDTVERWYNLTLKIDLLEKDITHQLQLREKINSDFLKDGTAYYNSQRQSLKDLLEEIAAQEQLNISRQEYLNARVENLKKTPLGKVYSMDENGLFSWNDNTNFRVNGRNIKGGHDFLENLYGFDDQKAANYTNKQKYDILIANGFADYMRTSANGEAIKADSDNDGQISEEEWESYYEAATEAFRDKMDEYKETTQDLADKVQEGKDQILKKQQEANELMREMRDNLIEVENNVLKAIEESRQREIDKLQDLRDAIEDSNLAYLDGLNKALENERDLYSLNESVDELNRLRRQRDILARSGGSASLIAQLNDEIALKTQDAYFDAQLQQIDALLEASDLQLLRLDNQIDIMTQTLEYQKEFGLLWGEVYNVMAKSPTEIAGFLAAHTESYWAESPVLQEDTFREWLFKSLQWDSFKTDLADTKSTVSEMYNLTKTLQKEADYKTFNEQMIALHGANYDSSGKYKQAFYEEYERSHDISKATQVALSAYTADENAKKAAAAALAKAQVQLLAAAQAQPAASAGGNVTVVSSYYVSDGASGCHMRQILSNGHANNLNSHPHTFGSNGKCTKCGYAKPVSNNSKTPQNEWATTNSNGKITTTKSEDVAKSWAASGKAVMSKFDEGGMVDKDLVALVHAKEGVLTAKQTSILRNDILGNKPNSLMNLLLTFKQAYQDNPVSSIALADSSGIIIENATVNMNVQQLANDYDARRAGEQALSEMLRIARKTSANNSIRR